MANTATAAISSRKPLASIAITRACSAWSAAGHHSTRSRPRTTRIRLSLDVQRSGKIVSNVFASSNVQLTQGSGFALPLDCQSPHAVSVLPSHRFETGVLPCEYDASSLPAPHTLLPFFDRGGGGACLDEEGQGRNRHAVRHPEPLSAALGLSKLADTPQYLLKMVYNCES